MKRAVRNQPAPPKEPNKIEESGRSSGVYFKTPDDGIEKDYPHRK